MIKIAAFSTVIVFLSLLSFCSSESINREFNSDYGKYLERRSYKEKMEDEENEKKVRESTRSHKENEKAMMEFNEKAKLKNPDQK
jgi:hypothetical protein